MEVFEACGDTVWLTCSEAWLHYTGSRMRASVLRKVRGKNGASGRGDVRGKAFEEF